MVDRHTLLHSENRPGYSFIKTVTVFLLSCVNSSYARLIVYILQGKTDGFLPSFLFSK